MKMIRTLLSAAWAVAFLASPAPSLASTIIDAEGDFLSTFISSPGPDMDILRFSVSAVESNFRFDVLVNGTIGTTSTVRYNVGVNRGSGTNRFGEDFRPGTLFDTTINLVPVGPAGEVRNFGATTVVIPLSPSAINVSGNRLSALIPMSLLPSTGFSPEDYTFLLWSRIQAGNPPQLGIADFAPDSGAIRAVPEPSSWVMMLTGFGAAGLAMRRPGRRRHFSSRAAA